ncbi:MAG: cellulose synthase operon protein YhjQ/BcsQ [Acidobacteriaceae bacterium]|jgi:cellulose synthase operon protein YhjQ
MGSRGTEIDGQPTADSTPEDVAALYSWANLQGAKYRDYSASRREYRAQVRYRAAKALLERELKAQEEAEASAAEAERVVLAADASARLPNGGDSPATRIHSQRDAESAARKAAADRVEAARRAEAAAHAAVLALREEREISDAHSSARRKALLYEESQQRRRQLAGPQPNTPWGEAALAAPDQLYAGSPFGSDILDPALDRPASPESRRAGAPEPSPEPDLEPTGPAWLYASQTPPQPRVLQTISQTPRGELPGGDTLQDSRERVAARWFALKDLIEHPGLDLPAMQPLRAGDPRTRLLAVFSLAGGVGKTSLVATLGRALSLQGEKVVITDTTSHGLLPIYFGVREVPPGVVSTLSPPPQSAAQPISLVACDLTGKGEFERQQEMLSEDILRGGQNHHRLLLDLASGSSWLVRSVADLHPMVLVPMAPDMNSALSLLAVEKLFRSIIDSDGRPVLPFYILNQFDATLPLHLDVREVLRRQLGDRLLRTSIRRSPAVSEALAEGMTVLDYAPDAPVSQDYLEVASWLRSVSPPATAEVRRAVRGEP